jgi:ABC-type nitrate/sulfonate/bicarbonate transport system substrate-binding protein
VHLHVWRPRHALIALLLLSAGCTSATSPPPAPAATAPPSASPVAALAPSPGALPPPSAPETVHLGVLGSVSDAGIFVALERGYFREQGIELELSTFDSAARMVAPLGARQLDVGAGSHSAGLLNAVARGIPLKLVADKGSALPGYGYQARCQSRGVAGVLAPPRGTDAG